MKAAEVYLVDAAGDHRVAGSNGTVRRELTVTNSGHVTTTTDASRVTGASEFVASGCVTVSLDPGQTWVSPN